MSFTNADLLYIKSRWAMLADLLKVKACQSIDTFAVAILNANYIFGPSH